MDDLDVTAAGWSAGFTGDDLRKFLTAVETELGRPLAGWELLAMADGWRQGADDARTHRQDMESGVAVFDCKNVPY